MQEEYEVFKFQLEFINSADDDKRSKSQQYFMELARSDCPLFIDNSIRFLNENDINPNQVQKMVVIICNVFQKYIVTNVENWQTIPNPSKDNLINSLINILINKIQISFLNESNIFKSIQNLISSILSFIFQISLDFNLLKYFAKIVSDSTNLITQKSENNQIYGNDSSEQYHHVFSSTHGALCALKSFFTIDFDILQYCFPQENRNEIALSFIQDITKNVFYLLRFKPLPKPTKEVCSSLILQIIENNYQSLENLDLPTIFQICCEALEGAEFILFKTIFDIILITAKISYRLENNQFLSSFASLTIFMMNNYQGDFFSKCASVWIEFGKFERHAVKSGIKNQNIIAKFSDYNEKKINIFKILFDRLCAITPEDSSPDQVDIPTSTGPSFYAAQALKTIYKANPGLVNGYVEAFFNENIKHDLGKCWHDIYSSVLALISITTKPRIEKTYSILENKLNVLLEQYSNFPLRIKETILAFIVKMIIIYPEILEFHFDNFFNLSLSVIMNQNLCVEILNRGCDILFYIGKLNPERLRVHLNELMEIIPKRAFDTQNINLYEVLSKLIILSPEDVANSFLVYLMQFIKNNKIESINRIGFIICFGTLCRRLKGEISQIFEIYEWLTSDIDNENLNEALIALTKLFKYTYASLLKIPESARLIQNYEFIHKIAPHIKSVLQNFDPEKEEFINAANVLMYLMNPLNIEAESSADIIEYDIIAPIAQSYPLNGSMLKALSAVINCQNNISDDKISNLLKWMNSENHYEISTSTAEGLTKLYTTMFLKVGPYANSTIIKCFFRLIIDLKKRKDFIYTDDLIEALLEGIYEIASAKELVYVHNIALSSASVNDIIKKGSESENAIVRQNANAVKKLLEKL